MYTVENLNWKASFCSKGAELQSLFHKPTSRELMWQANPAYWAKTSPILFPIIGSLKDNCYTYQGKQYMLARHGFARDRDFEVSRRDHNRIEFVLRSDAESWAIYPFAFELSVCYELTESGLSVIYKVRNPDERSNLYFSLGAHPAFAIQVDRDKKYSDYTLHFKADDALKITRLEDNLLSEDSEYMNLSQHKLQLSYSLFYDDALVLNDLKSEEITLSCTKDPHNISFHFHNFPYFGLWAAKDANFVCVEPWAGIADYPSHNGRLEEKAGMMTLASGQEWSATWKVGVS